MSKPVYKVWEGSDMMAKYLDLEVAAETARRAWQYSRSLGGSSSIYVELADEDRRSGDHVPVSIERHAWVIVKGPAAYRMPECYYTADVRGAMWVIDSAYAVQFEREQDAQRMLRMVRRVSDYDGAFAEAFVKQVLVDYITEE